MNTEEKAKAYDEAYKRVAIRFGSNIADELFPELCESEDEKIRKELINRINGLWENDAAMWPSTLEEKNKYITWLEKQGEQKPQRMVSAEAKEAMYDKPKWSEEDEGICRAIINDIANDKSMCKFEISKRVCDAQINWLKSLKERIGG